jgi:hypothetical protein
VNQSLILELEVFMAVEGIDPYFVTPPAATPPPAETPAPAPEPEVITEENTGTTIDTSA